MKKLHLLIIILFISVNAFNQTLTAKFSADNCYAVYVGTNNSTYQKVLPLGNSFGVTNTTANTIFNATVVSDVQYQQGDYLYVIAWADTKGCQGLVGEFEDTETVLTGDLGWEVFATGRNYIPNQFPSQSLVNQMIGLANSTSGWQAPFVGPSNANSRTVCGAYSRVNKVNGISDEAKWIWYDSGRDNNPQAPFSAFNHGEFLIFRFPTKLVNTDKPIVNQGVVREYDLCCPPIIKEDFQEMLTIEGGFGTHTVKFTPTLEWRKKMQAYVDYRCALNPCLDGFTFAPLVRRPKTGTTDDFDLAPSSILEQGFMSFRKNDPNATCWIGTNADQVYNGAHLGGVDLNSNSWHRLQTSLWGFSDDSGSCVGWDQGLCQSIDIDYKLLVKFDKRNPKSMKKKNLIRLDNRNMVRVKYK